MAEQGQRPKSLSVTTFERPQTIPIQACTLRALDTHSGTKYSVTEGNAKALVSLKVYRYETVGNL